MKMKTLLVLFIGVFAIPESVTAHQCGRGWASFENNCYYFSTSTMNFKDAMISCYNRGSSLLVIRNSREDKWVDLQCRLRGYLNGVWLGFSDIQREGHMVAISDSRKPGYVNWIGGEPNNAVGKEHCAMYWTARRGWNDTQCSDRLHVVCTKK
ncbi:perlucin-like protein isoform X3 [Crassostrea virginica]